MDKNLKKLHDETDSFDLKIKYTFEMVYIIENQKSLSSELSINELLYELLTGLYCESLNEEITTISLEIISILESNYKEYNYDNNELYDVIICAYIDTKKYKKAYDIYTNYSNFIEYPLLSHYYRFEDIFKAYKKLLELENAITLGIQNIDTYIKITNIYDDYFEDIEQVEFYLNKALEFEPNSIKINLIKLQRDSTIEEFEVIQPRYIKFLKSTNNNADVVRAFLNFTYPSRSYNLVNTQITASLANELLLKDEEVDYVKLIALYNELEDEKNEFRVLKYAEIKMEDGKKKKDIYWDLGYYYEESGDFKNAIKNYKLYKKYQRVWYDNSKGELEKDIMELKKKLLETLEV